MAYLRFRKWAPFSIHTYIHIHAVLFFYLIFGGSTNTCVWSQCGLYTLYNIHTQCICVNVNGIVCYARRTAMYALEYCISVFK